MYKKVHLRLTLLCAGITTIIMTVMSFAYLRVSESNLYKNQFAAFENDVRTISAGLERQSIITMEYLSQMKTENDYSFLLLDNGIPFLFHQLTELSDPSGQSLLDEILTACEDIRTPSSSGHLEAAEPLPAWQSYTCDGALFGTDYTSFQLFSKAMGRNYFCSVIRIERGASALQAIVLFPLEALEMQIREQRFFFLGINLLTLLLLLVFSWLFTGQLLKPIWENQQQQIQFIASASHELRTPLAVILSSAECLSDSATEKQTGFIKNISQSGAAMSALIEDMLTLSLSDSHRFSIQKQPTELDTLLLNAYEAFEPLARQKSIHLTLTLPEEALPPYACDPGRISQVVSILLHNAISYTPAGGCIRLSLSHEKGTFSISVADNGIGISDADKKKIFDRFYRAEASRSTKGHFGLGLSIAHGIVAAHHGTLTVKDAPEKGSLFTATFPCR